MEPDTLFGCSSASIVDNKNKLRLEATILSFPNSEKEFILHPAALPSLFRVDS